MVSHLRGELKWLAGVLGKERDGQIMHQRLNHMIAGEPTDLIPGPVSQRIDEQLGADPHPAQLKTLEALGDGRYFRLLDALDALLTAPPLTDLASDPAHRIIPDLIRKGWKRLRKAINAAMRTPGVVARDLLRRLGIEAHTRGENGFGYGRLHALEQAVATDSEARFLRAWKDFPSIKSV